MNADPDPSPLPAVIVETGPEDKPPEATIVWLHGLGDDGNGFAPFVPELRIPEQRRFRFVFPHAPTRPITLNQGMVMRAWYDIDMNLNRDKDEQGVRESARLIEGLLAAEKQRGVPASRMVLAGFSMGGALALHVGLRHAESLAGIMVLAGYLLLADHLDDEASDANRGTPILQCHGTLDPLVPLQIGQYGAELVKARGYSVSWKTYPAMHTIHPREVEDIREWLLQVLSL